MQGNIRIVLTLSILKKKNTVTSDWIENKINKVHNAYLCFIEFKVGNWSEKKNLLAMFCIVCQYVISRYWYNFQYQYISTLVSFCKITYSIGTGTKYQCTTVYDHD